MISSMLLATSTGMGPLLLQALLFGISSGAFYTILRPELYRNVREIA